MARRKILRRLRHGRRLACRGGPKGLTRGIILLSSSGKGERTVRTLWLLDIDGVINAVPEWGHGTPLHVWDTWISKDVKNSTDTWPILVAQPVLDFLIYIHESGLAEIRWHTSWQEEALDFGDSFGLPTFHVQPCPEAMKNGTPSWWKLPTVQRELSTGRRVLWTDDHINREMNGGTRRLLGLLPHLKMVVPNTATGLSPDDLVDILYFLEEIQ
jgi:hypothetical protein